MTVLLCLSCEKKMRLPATFKGTKARCPHCAAVLPVPASDGITEIPEAAPAPAKNKTAPPPPDDPVEDVDIVEEAEDEPRDRKRSRRAGRRERQDEDEDRRPRGKRRREVEEDGPAVGARRSSGGPTADHAGEWLGYAGLAYYGVGLMMLFNLVLNLFRPGMTVGGVVGTLVVAPIIIALVLKFGTYVKEVGDEVFRGRTGRKTLAGVLAVVFGLPPLLLGLAGSILILEGLRQAITGGSLFATVSWSDFINVPIFGAIGGLSVYGGVQTLRLPFRDRR